MKLWYLALLTLVFSLLLYVILGFQPQPGVLQAPELAAPIEVILKSDEQNPMDFWDVLRRGVLDAAKEYGVEVHFSGPPQESQVGRQIEILEQVIAEDPPLILLAAGDYQRLAPPLEQALARRIPVVTFDSAVNSSVPLSFIATDNVVAGEKAGRELERIMQYSPRREIAIVSHIQGAGTAIDREAGVRGVLSKEHIIGTWFCDVNEDRAYRITLELLNNSQLGGIVALNEAATLGVARAVAERNAQDRVLVVGFDNASRELEYLEQGVLKATVVQRPYNIGYMAIKSAVEALNGQRVRDFIDTGSVLITSSNMFQKEFQELLFPFPPQE